MKSPDAEHEPLWMANKENIVNRGRSGIAVSKLSYSKQKGLMIREERGFEGSSKIEPVPSQTSKVTSKNMEEMENVAINDSDERKEEIYKKFVSKLAAFRKYGEKGILTTKQKNDRLIYWRRYLKFIQHGSLAAKHEYKKTLVECLTELEKDEYYQNDLAFVKLWIKQAMLSEKQETVFRHMRHKGIGLKVSAYYIATANDAERRGQYEFAMTVYNKGLENGAEPKDYLLKKQSEFYERFGRRCMQLGQSTTQPPVALSRPQSYGPAGNDSALPKKPRAVLGEKVSNASLIAAHDIRQPHLIPQMPKTKIATAPKANGAAAFEIYQDSPAAIQDAISQPWKSDNAAATSLKTSFANIALDPTYEKENLDAPTHWAAGGLKIKKQSCLVPSLRVVPSKENVSGQIYVEEMHIPCKSTVLKDTHALRPVDPATRTILETDPFVEGHVKKKKNVRAPSNNYAETNGEAKQLPVIKTPNQPACIQKIPREIRANSDDADVTLHTALAMEAFKGLETEVKPKKEASKLRLEQSRPDNIIKKKLEPKITAKSDLEKSYLGCSYSKDHENLNGTLIEFNALNFADFADEPPVKNLSSLQAEVKSQQFKYFTPEQQTLGASVFPLKKNFDPSLLTGKIYCEDDEINQSSSKCTSETATPTRR